MKRLSMLVAFVAACLIFLPVRGAHADPCTDLGGLVIGAECQISGNVGNKSGIFNLTQSLHMLAGSKIVVPDAPGGNPLTIRVCASPTVCHFVMEPGAVITGNVTHADAAQGTGAAIDISATGSILLGGSGGLGASITSTQTGGSCAGGRGGNITLTAVSSITTQPASVISANGKPCPGGTIKLLATEGTVTVGGLVTSDSTFSGTGALQPPGGGPITIIARCDLSITGTVRSSGQDAGADLIHLEGGCSVTIDGLVASTGGGHGIPNNPPNHCYGPVGNPSRPDKPQNSTACIEVWAGDSLVIGPTGELNADLGVDGSNEGISWIDLYSRGNITINADGTLPFAVHANGVGGSGGDGEEGGIVTVKSKEGSVTASGKALQATSVKASNSDAGRVTVEAAGTVLLSGNTPTLEARGNDLGGVIAVRAFTGALSWLSGVGDARPIATGTIGLTACTTVTTTSTNFNGEVPSVTTGLCVPAQPTLPAYVLLPTCLCGGEFPPGVPCPEDQFRVVSRTVDDVQHDGVPNHPTLSEAVQHAGAIDVIGVFINTDDNVTIASKALVITQCTRARITALDSSLPTVSVSTPDPLLVIGLDTVGGTVGWLLQSGGHELRGVRASGASEAGIKIAGDGNSVSWNSVKENGTGIVVSGLFNELRGGTVELNTKNGIELTSTAQGNTVQGATVQLNGASGFMVGGTGNTIIDNPRIDSNAKNGVMVTGTGNLIKGNVAGSDKKKGNGKDGFRVTAGGNSLVGNRANANLGDGFDISGGGPGDPNSLKNNQSNSGSPGSKNENKGAEYLLLDNVTSVDGNKADNASVAKDAKCPLFPKKRQIVDFVTPYVCE